MSSIPSLRPPMVEKILAQNEGISFTTHSSGRYYDITYTYSVRGGEMYQRETGRTSLDGDIDKEYKLCHEEKQRAIRNYAGYFNFDGLS